MTIIPEQVQDNKMINIKESNKNHKHDTQFAKACLRSIKQYKPYYIVADKAYDTEPIRKIINEELNSFNIIPIKPNQKQDYTDLKVQHYSDI
ncbi:transposase [Methanosphaera sp. WGK6]|uniref:transposase n=1 Tax=Methanosphaera sp. WGK6 TaxID=1561964 RepID=UPI00084BC987|nr:transposase [Methanosphaera sp. WGK6]